MKSKKITKKLILNKKTVADLNNGDMKNAHGGGELKITIEWTNCTDCPATFSCGGTCLNTCAASCGQSASPPCHCGFLP